jgi:hypothetical protein
VRVIALVAVIAEAAFVILIIRGRRLKIGTGQIIEQHFETGSEQILPALAQMFEKRGLMLQQLVERAVEGSYLS